MNILVTGGSGFIGSHLVKKLNENNTVFIADTKNNNKIGGLNYKYILQDNKIDAVFHLAANSDISTGNPKIEYENTFKTTIILLNDCVKYGINQFIFASSSAIYGETYKPITENYGLLLPISHYGAAKLASESFICSYAKAYNIKSWILRFPNVVGSNATHGVILDLLKKNKANPNLLQVLGNGDQLKPYIHVSELIDAILFIWRNVKEWVNIYNISSIGRTTVKEIVEMITTGNIQYLGGKAWIGDCEKYEYDTTKLKKLGWSPKMTSTESVKLAIEEIKKEI
jgi:UDP-glucose 4-epimerase